MKHHSAPPTKDTNRFLAIQHLKPASLALSLALIVATATYSPQAHAFDLSGPRPSARQNLATHAKPPHQSLQAAAKNRDATPQNLKPTKRSWRNQAPHHGSRPLLAQ
ncbi:MAG: hypothetical protein KC476_06705, partial [Cyanobacteria bacterium HKST-UBA06]|nr:hypothetical protein [Cyanobacteria bacterium HKST-UBA06]